MRSALSAKLGENSLTVVMDSSHWKVTRPRIFKRSSQGLGVTGKVLIVDSSENKNLLLSSRNLPKVKLVPGTGVKFSMW